jgi:hypothetical protein
MTRGYSPIALFRQDGFALVFSLNSFFGSTFISKAKLELKP